MRRMLTGLAVLIILQYIQIRTHYIVHLKSENSVMSVLPQQEKARNKVGTNGYSCVPMKLYYFPHLVNYSVRSHVRVYDPGLTCIHTHLRSVAFSLERHWSELCFESQLYFDKEKGQCRHGGEKPQKPSTLPYHTTVH